MFSSSKSKVSTEHVNKIVTSILNKRQKHVVEQQKTFLQRNTDEQNKRNNYLVDKYTTKKQTISSKENITPSVKPISPKKKTNTKKRNDKVFRSDDDDDDFVDIKKRPKVILQPKQMPMEIKCDPIKECLESIISSIENNDAICPICNQLLSNLTTIDQREQHVNRCLEDSQLNNFALKHQTTLLSYSKLSSTNRTKLEKSSTNFKCQICGISFNVKRTYLIHLKKCSNQNSVQLKHVINFAAKTNTVTVDQPKVASSVKKQFEPTIKNRIIKMEIPKTEDDEQQQLAVALSASMKTALEPPNAFDILQAASKKNKTIDLFLTSLWNVSIEDKIKISATRLSKLCERVITVDYSKNTYKFSPSLLQQTSQMNFGSVNWWNITQTDPLDDEIPMTQLVRVLDTSIDDDLII